MSLRAIFYAYVLGGITFIPLALFVLVCYTIYTSVPAETLERTKKCDGEFLTSLTDNGDLSTAGTPDINDIPKARKGWLTVRRTFEETPTDGSYVGFVRGFLDARSKDPKRSRPKDTWYVVLKGKILYLYEDEGMTECEAVVELGGHDVVIYPEGLQDGELFAKRHAICLKPKASTPTPAALSPTTEAKDESGTSETHRTGVGDTASVELAERPQERSDDTKIVALDGAAPWFLFVRSAVEMEDWYLALIHASDNQPNTPVLAPLEAVFRSSDMSHLVATIDEQPDVIPMRWLNALLGRLFFSFYRTQFLESYIIGRLMRKLDKIKRPSFLTHIIVREVSVGNTSPSFSKPMLKELTQEGDAAVEVHLYYKGEVRVTIEAVATINLGARFKPYAVKLVLAAVLRELEGNLLIKVKRPPSSRIWYAFTQMPRMVLDVEPVVSDRQITWSMILSTIESKLKEVIQESVVLPSMDDIAFFGSSQYSHRGGIWSDASRQEKSSTLFSTPVIPGDDLKQATTLPTTESRTAPVSSCATPESTPPLHRSHSADAQQDLGATLELTEDPPQRTPVGANTSSPVPLDISSLPRRRTWFGTSHDENLHTAEDFEDPNDTLEGRGRDRVETPLSLGLDLSPPSQSALGSNPPASDDGAHLKPIPIPLKTTRRSVSPSHSPQDPLPVTPHVISASAPEGHQVDSSRAQSPPLSGSNVTPKNPLISPTFFQTLKSRDKQAISVTAKEAIRKLGVNWGTLRKGSDTAIIPPAPEETSSDSDVLHHSEPNKPHKPRPSYAEVRAAVEQRRGKAVVEPSVPVLDLSGRTQSDENDSVLSSSETLSGESHDKVLPYEIGGANTSSSTSPLHTRKGPDSSPSRSISPPLQLARSTSRRSNPPDGPPVISEPPSSVPIQTQPPPPKIMSIPGIHASHRGDVMSMGYAPPSLPPGLEPKKAPAIQSVYRLWQKTVQQDQQQQSLPSTELADEESPPQLATATEVLPPALSGKLVPPPLPPRSLSQQTQTLAKDVNPLSLELASSPASQALQSIATKDQSQRASLEAQSKASLPLLVGPHKGPPEHSLTHGNTHEPTPAFIPPSPEVTPTGGDGSGNNPGVGIQSPALPPRRPPMSA